MQMIDVLKRLAELDSNNPNVENKMGTMESLLTVSNVSSEVSKINENAETVQECGPISPMPAASRGPASINMSAGSGEELSGLIRDIMSLAGVGKESPHSDKSIEVTPANAIEPDSDMLANIKMIDSMNSPNDIQPIDDDDKPFEEMDDRYYDNSPEEEIEPYDYGDKQVDPKPQGLPQRQGDNPYKPTKESIDALAQKLLAEFHSTINQGNR